MSRTPVRHPLPSLLLAGALGAATLPLGGYAAVPGPAVESPPLKAEAETEGASGLGIELLGLRPSAAGYMLDLRYRVVDPEKAAPLLDRKLQPHLRDEATGAKLFVPVAAKVGALRKTGGVPKAGQTYAMLFANPGKYLASGAEVTLVIGERQVRGLTVQ